MSQLRFKVGDYVSYTLANKELFCGEIIKAEKTKGVKPYTIKDEDGNIKYAHEIYLSLRARKKKITYYFWAEIGKVVLTTVIDNYTTLEAAYNYCESLMKANPLYNGKSQVFIREIK